MRANLRFDDAIDLFIFIKQNLKMKDSKNVKNYNCIKL